MPWLPAVGLAIAFLLSLVLGIIHGDVSRGLFSGIMSVIFGGLAAAVFMIAVDITLEVLGKHSWSNTASELVRILWPLFSLVIAVTMTPDFLTFRSKQTPLSPGTYEYCREDRLGIEYCEEIEVE